MPDSFVIRSKGYRRRSNARYSEQEMELRGIAQRLHSLMASVGGKSAMVHVYADGKTGAPMVAGNLYGGGPNVGYYAVRPLVEFKEPLEVDCE